jgi:hypothetical protein
LFPFYPLFPLSGSGEPATKKPALRRQSAGLVCAEQLERESGALARPPFALAVSGDLCQAALRPQAEFKSTQVQILAP